MEPAGKRARADARKRGDRMGLNVGEVVSYQEPSGEEMAGLVVEIRRNDCRVLDLDRERSYWLPQAHLNRGARTIEKGSATSLLSSLVLHVNGSVLEVERVGGGDVRAQIGCPELDADGVDQIRKYFGDSYRSLRILPGGLGKIYLVVEFRPRSARGDRAAG